ncbi:hypothetical protein KP509_34G071600 [Ceratopteris richardii]|nr:hypothetical protein KP509_34G071600 [Ceratopteris richardii]
MLLQGDPSDACSSLGALPSVLMEETTLVMLTMRGNCSFEAKIRNAQIAGFSAVIVYASDYKSNLVSMAGNSEDLHLYAVFVSRAAGEVLLQYLGDENSTVTLLPSTEDMRWSLGVIISVSVSAFSAAVVTWLFTKNQRMRRLFSRLLEEQETSVLRPSTVNAMPIITFGSPEVEQRAGRNKCKICLEDYKVKESLRVLPCKHRFHSRCVDIWLTAWQASCPICRSDLCEIPDARVSERTPLLESNASPGLVDWCWSTKKVVSELQLHLNPRESFTYSSNTVGKPSSWRSALHSGGAAGSTRARECETVSPSENCIPVPALTCFHIRQEIIAP